MARMIEGKTGFQWRIGGAGWSPWGGMRMNELAMRAPVNSGPELGPVLLVEELRVRPYWMRLMRGELALREMRVERPVGDVPMELLAAMMPAGRPPVIATADTGPSGSDKPDRKRSSSGDDPPKKNPKPKPSARNRPKVAADEGDSDPPPGPVGRLRVIGGNLRLYSLQAPASGLRFSGVELDTPISGPVAGGGLDIAEVSRAGSPLATGLRAHLEWVRPVLSLKETSGNWNGLPLRVRGQIMMKAHLPVSIEVQTSPSALPPVEIAGLPGVTLEAERVEMRARLRGELTRPVSWSGDLVAGVQQVVLSSNGQPLLGFHTGRLVAYVSGGALEIPDARLVGESFSILGNGAIHHSGQVLGVGRLVADWEYAQAVSRMAVGSGWSRWTSRWLQPFETPDRFYRDIHLEGRLLEATVDVGRRGEELPLSTAVQRIAAFALGEKREDDEGEGHDPRWDALLLEQ